jgi:hypothetical protein
VSRSTCGEGFIARAGASYCSAACKQRAHRTRKGGNRNAPVADKAALFRRPKQRRPEAGGHCAEAVELLTALDAEVAENCEERGEGPLEWSSADRTVLGLIACSIDRKVDLSAHYSATLTRSCRSSWPRSCGCWRRILRGCSSR